MPNASRSFVASDKYERVGPDYFGYYTSEVVNLLSQDEDIFPVSTQIPELPESKYEEGRKKNLVNQSDNCSGPSYSNGIGAGLSDFKKDRLKSLLRQSVITLSSEVDEVVDPVFAAYHLQSNLRSIPHSLNDTVTASDDVGQVPCKTLKVSSSSSSDKFLEQTTNVNPQCNRKASDDLQFLLENDNVEVAGNGYMEEQLELLLDTIMFKCRSMTLAEKQQLQSLIQKLPARNLDRVVELICRNRPVEEQSCDEIFVDLEKEGNATLWRLYYYIEAVEKAKSLSCSEEA
ncbi:Transcription factor GTE1 [Spatholobus suberectus]|nr:Transcription factor GTE1 [Spatholobus suberectus]